MMYRYDDTEEGYLLAFPSGELFVREGYNGFDCTPTVREATVFVDLAATRRAIEKARQTYGQVEFTTKKVRRTQTWQVEEL